MADELSKSNLQKARDEYEKTLSGWSNLTHDAGSLWDEEHNIMMQEFPERFQRDGCISYPCDFKCLSKWKWPGLWANYTNEVDLSELQTVTSEAFSLNPNPEVPSDEVAREQIDILRGLYGVGTATATVLLTFWKPEIYTVMDVRALSTLKRNGRWDGKSKANTSEYPAYVRECHQLADETGLELRDVDRALWQLGESGH